MMWRTKTFLTVILSIFWFLCQGQKTIGGTVIDASNEEPLAFCHVILSDGATGTITNADGRFEIEVADTEVILTFSFIGYEKKELVAGQVEDLRFVELNPLSISLDELVIYAEDDYLYGLIADCKSVMTSFPKETAKTHFHLSTKVNNEPNEMLECYYNSLIEGGVIRDLRIKNGRAAMPDGGDKFFLNMQTTVALRLMDIFNKNPHYPATPFQYGKKKMKRQYSLRRLPTFSDTNTVHLEFEAKNDLDEHFSGEMWIDKTSKQLLKVDMLSGENTSVYPFYSIGDKTRINDLRFKLAQTYQKDDDIVRLNHIDYSYDFSLDHKRNKSDWEDWNLSTSCQIYFFDHGNAFLLPYFDYDQTLSDYRIISLLPYDPVFWQKQHGAPLSKNQLEQLEYFDREGRLINFDIDFIAYYDNDTLVDRNAFFEQENIFWSKETRVKFGRSKSPNAPRQAEFLGDMVAPVVQIFLDANEYNGQWQYKSRTFLDIYNSYNYIGQSDLRDCFVNIYFDLGEITRRKMLEELESGPQDRESIDRIYRKHIDELEAKWTRYKKEVQQGHVWDKFVEWNDLVKKETGIDNIVLHKVTLESN